MAASCKLPVETQFEDIKVFLLEYVGLPWVYHGLPWGWLGPMVFSTIQLIQRTTLFPAPQDACVAVKAVQWLCPAGRSILRAWLFWHPSLGQEICSPMSRHRDDQGLVQWRISMDISARDSKLLYFV